MILAIPTDLDLYDVHTTHTIQSYIEHALNVYDPNAQSSFYQFYFAERGVLVTAPPMPRQRRAVSLGSKRFLAQVLNVTKLDANRLLVRAVIQDREKSYNLVRLYSVCPQLAGVRDMRCVSQEDCERLMQIGFFCGATAYSPLLQAEGKTHLTDCSS